MLKSKKVRKIMLIILIIIILIFISTKVLAIGSFLPGTIKGNESAIPKGTMKKVGNAVMRLLQVLGIAVSVIVLTVMGIKYMLGSAEEKAEYKKTLIPYIIGAALLFAASAFVSVIYSLFTGIRM